MSLILDALRKSDVERSRQQAPQVAGTASAPPERPRRAWVVPVVVLLVLNAALLAWLVLRPAVTDERRAADEPAATVPAASVTAPERSASGSRPTPAAPSTEPVRQRPKAVVRSLADETRVAAAAEDDTAPSGNASGIVATEATGGAAVDAAGDGGRRGSVAAPADARALIDRGVVTADALAIELHVFGTDPARRFAFIGGRKVAAGDTLAAGIGIVEVVQDGVIIEHRGTRYLLRRD